MNIIENYLFFLNEEDKIHPKAKEGASWFAATPASDVAVAGITGGTAYKTGKAAGLAGKTIAKNVALHTAKGAALSLAGYAAYRVIRSWFDKCTKACGTLEINTSKRQLCLLNCKKQSLEKQLVVAKEKNPKTIPTIQKKLNDTNDKIMKYNKYLQTKKKG